MNSHRISRLALALAFGHLAACAEPNVTDATTRTRDAAQSLSGLTANLVECPTSEATSSTAIVSPLGGVVSAGGTSIMIPAGALLASAEVTVTVPASQYMEVDVSVSGVDHFLFELPVTVTLSYARCGRNNLNKSPLSVWYIDSDTKAPLAPMGGFDNKLTRTVTFTTGHLSGYAVAN